MDTQQTILVLGDSHSEVFKHCNDKSPNIIFDVCCVFGCTAYGLLNSKSETSTLSKFREAINKKKYDKVIVMVGEVDCNYLIWVRSKAKNIQVDEHVKLSVDNLFTFINENLYMYNPEDIIVTGSILSVTKDKTDKSQLIYERRAQVLASQCDRTKKTLLFNSFIENKCNKKGHGYMDITKQTISDNGLINDEYIHPNEFDHHLNLEKTYQFWLDNIEN